MIKKSFLLSITLLISTIAVNSQTNQAIEDSKENIQMMEQLYGIATRDFEKTEIKKYDSKIATALQNYFENSIKDKNNITDTKNVEKIAIEIANYFKSQKEVHEAYALSSMMFMVNLSKLVLLFTEKVISPQQTKNLQDAIIKMHELNQDINLSHIEQQLLEIANSLQKTA